MPYRRGEPRRAIHELDARSTSMRCAARVRGRRTTAPVTVHRWICVDVIHDAMIRGCPSCGPRIGDTPRMRSSILMLGLVVGEVAAGCGFHSPAGAAPDGGAGGDSG